MYNYVYVYVIYNIYVQLYIWPVRRFSYQMSQDFLTRLLGGDRANFSATDTGKTRKKYCGLHLAINNQRIFANSVQEM